MSPEPPVCMSSICLNGVSTCTSRGHLPVLFQNFCRSQPSTSHLTAINSFLLMFKTSAHLPLFPAKASSAPSANPTCSSLKRNTEFYHKSERTQQVPRWSWHHILSSAIEIGSRLILTSALALESVHSTTVTGILLRHESQPVPFQCLPVSDERHILHSDSPGWMFHGLSDFLALFFLIWLQ